MENQKNDNLNLLVVDVALAQQFGLELHIVGHG